ncbi:MAG TPA: hypothetical protein VGN69_04395 [Solirubrobacteraceae bacterium]|nr:hypothetical protein [Solirubrobacteraceae bacterium]
MTISTSIGAAAVLSLGGPGAAAARVTEIGKPAVAAVPSCPTSPCLAVSRTTGFQAKVGTSRGLFTVPRDGKIVAWTISLGKPTRKQITFFNTNEGGAASAGITILRPGKHLVYRVVDNSPLVALTPYFGLTAQFPLDRTLAVKRGWVVALTVPTWAPALAVGFRNDTSWRASRAKSKCNDTTTQSAQQRNGTLIQFYCLYRTARLTYSATLISTP